MAIFRSKPSNFGFFVLVPKSPIHTGLIYVKNPKPYISSLGPFKLFIIVMVQVDYDSPHLRGPSNGNNQAKDP
jgi:hypothetical protein